MAIYVPGKRDSRGRLRGAGKREVVAALSLVAMVDLFTVLAVFLLQNMATTGQAMDLDSQVELPNAAAVKELAPTNVVVISPEKIAFNQDKVADFRRVKEQEDWMVPKLREKIEEVIRLGQKEKASLKNKIKGAINKSDGVGDKVDDFRKVTIQADKKIDFLTVKKIMYTVTEAGIYEINFAVIKRIPDEDSL